MQLENFRATLKSAVAELVTRRGENVPLGTTAIAGALRVTRPLVIGVIAELEEENVVERCYYGGREIWCAPRHADEWNRREQQRKIANVNQSHLWMYRRLQ